MKNKKIKILINKPEDEVFSFTLNLENTPLWIDSIVKEVASDKEPRLGTVYKNQNRKGQNLSVWKILKNL